MGRKPHRASRSFVGGRSSERAAQPAKADLSAETKQYLIKTLSNASHSEVASILQAIRFQQAGLISNPSAEHRNDAIAAEAHKYLSTPDGKAALDRGRDKLIEAEAKRYLISSEGRKRFEKAIADLGAVELVESDDLMNRICRAAANREVEIWLRSQRGKQAVDAMLVRAIDERMLALAALERSDWIKHKLRELNDGQATT